MNEQSSNTKYIVGIRSLVERTVWKDHPFIGPDDKKHFKAGTVVQQVEFTSLKEAKRKEADLNWQYAGGSRHCLVHGPYLFKLYRDEFEIFIEEV
jgi:hypothetical protein